MFEMLEDYELIIQENEKSFEKEFCSGGDIMDVTGVFWNSERMRVEWVLDSGQHLSNSFSIGQFDAWVNKSFRS